MPLTLPEPDIGVIENKKQIVNDLRKISSNIIHLDDEIKPYETDGLSVYRQKPIAVVLPETTAEVSKILKYCYENKIKVAITPKIKNIIKIEEKNFIASFSEYFSLIRMYLGINISVKDPKEKNLSTL